MSIYWELFYTNGGWFTWVLAAVTVGTAVYTGVKANQDKKKAQGAAGAANKANQKALGGIPAYQQPPLPAYQPWNFKSNQKRAIEEDANAYARSDADFRKRHSPLVMAEKLAEERTLKDQRGEHEFMPQMQSESARLGIADTLGNLGTTGAASVLAPGGAGEANVARHLGMDIMKFQDRNRANRMASLNQAEELFPRRTFGMNGADYVASSQADVSNRNAWAAANYERDAAAEAARVGQAMNIANAQQTSANEMAKAQAASTAARDAAVTASVSSALQAGAGAYGKYAAANPTVPQAGSTSVSSAAVPRIAATKGAPAYGYTPKAGWASTGGVWA